MGFSLKIWIIFLTFNIIWFEIPGLYISKRLIEKKMNWAKRLLLGYFLGFMVMTILYFVESMVKVPIILVAGPVLFVFGLVYWIRSGCPSLFEEEKIRWPEVCLFAYLFLMGIVTYQYKNTVALRRDSIQIYHDYLYHVGNIIALAKEMQPMDIRVYGVTFFYHYFYDLIYGMCKHIFGMDAYSLLTTGMPLLAAFPLTLGLKIVVDRVLKGKDADCKKVALIYLCFFTSCMALEPILFGSRIPLSWMNYHFYSNGNALGLAVAVFSITLEIIVDHWDDKLSIRTCIVVCLLSMVATGMKGPTGMLLLAMTVAVFLVEALITKSFSVNKLLFVISEFIGFVLVYVLVDAGGVSTGSNNRATTISPKGTIESCLASRAFTKITGISADTFPGIIIVLILISICLIGPFILPFTAWVVRKFKELFANWIIGDVFDWFAIAGVLIALGGTLFITIEGFSQGYLMISASVLVLYGVMRYMQQGKLNIIKTIQKFFFGVGTLFLVVEVGFLVNDALNNKSAYYYEVNDDYSWVSPGEVEGYKWLKNNTEPSALLASDRQSEMTDYRSMYFYLGAFSERQVYIEGFSYSDLSDEKEAEMLAKNAAFYSDDGVEVETLLEQNGIDYLVVHSIMTPGYMPSTDRLTNVFENEDIQIYRFD